MRDGRYTLRLEELTPRVLPRSPFEAPSLGPPPAPGADAVWVGTVDELQTAVRNVRSGQTIVVRPGTYDLTETLVVGKFGPVADVTIRGATDDFRDVVIRGRGMENADYGAVPSGVSVYDAQNVTVADLSVGDVYFHPFDIQGGMGAARVHLYHVRGFDGGEQIVKSSAGGGADFCSIEYSLFEYTVAPPTTDHGGGVGYTGGLHAHEADGWAIRDNLWRNFHTPDSSATWFAPVILMWNGSRDTVVEGNTFIDCDRAVAFGLVDAAGFDHQGGVIRNNFVYQTPGLFSAARRAESDGQILVYDSPGTAVYNNTVLTNGNSRYSIEVRWATTGVEFVNNLADAPLHARDGGAYTAAGNYLSADPTLFANPAAGDLHLVENAATLASVIDKAVSLTGVSTDWDGDQRSAVADVGADEWHPVPPPAVAPAPAEPAGPPAPTPAAPAGPALSGAVGGPFGLVFALNSDGSVRFVRMAAYPGYEGALSTAVADVNGDGIPDVITGTASGVGVVRVFSGTDGAELTSFLPFGALSVGVGVTAGDADGDGFADIFVAPVGFPLYAVFSGRDRSFLGFGPAGGDLVG
ncbi:MAG: hypothetical protein J0I06_15515 [Planctomycetes bacterium]|nr:hypothetical protein [Planctomycetota bacterium]